MRATKAPQQWLGVVADATGASLLAVRGRGSRFVTTARSRIDYEIENLDDATWQANLRRFAEANGLRGCAAHLLFVGSGTVVQKLQMPPMNERNRMRAVRTRLTNYASGRELVVDTRVERRLPAAKGVGVLAAGVDCRLVRGLYRACRKAGLRPTSATGLATAFEAPSAQGRVVQLIVADRTTTIQLFEQGCLISCRDVLLGRQDFVAAYRRPILTDAGPVTLSQEQAERLSREVGVPVGRQDEMLPGIPATRLWPLLTPVLQRLRNELEQTLAHNYPDAAVAPIVHVMALPALPGLAGYLAAELNLEASDAAAGAVEDAYLAAIHADGTDERKIDFRPPEEQFVARYAKVGLAACVAAAFVILANSAGPRAAQARLTELAPAAETLQAQLARMRVERDAAQRELDELTAKLRSRTRLSRVLLPAVPATGVFKALFASVPAGIRLLDVQLDAAADPATLTVSAVCGADVVASVTAARWARGLADSAFFTEAEVAAVTAQDDENGAIVEIRALLR